jgi:cell division protease FtsH
MYNIALILLFILGANGFFLKSPLTRVRRSNMLLRFDPSSIHRHYHYSKRYYENGLKRNGNSSQPDNMRNLNNEDQSEITIILQNGFFQDLNELYKEIEDELNRDDEEGGDMEEQPDMGDSGKAIFNPFHEPHKRTANPYMRRFQKEFKKAEDEAKLKSANFRVLKNYDTKFSDVGGYANVKEELTQSIDILCDYQKYMKYNVRIPKGIIFEGPPGNGKTLLAKSLAGEAGCGFIAVSGSDFQEKYVGVGSSRIREMFELAKKNEPCIIFIDEIDAVGRHRSGDGESSSSERDNTLNSLLVELDGFKNNTGVFIVGATNRIDLLDPALVRPGRIDKKIFVGLPDMATRKEVIRIHIRGKPHDKSVVIDELVELTEGLSCAQIENLLNEAMLYALRNMKVKDENNIQFTYSDIDIILNKMIGGWQSNEHEFSSDMIDRIAVHEMGHAILGYLSRHHSKLRKVVLNLSSPKTPGYTIFDRSPSGIHLKDSLFEHLIILLGGRIAEEIIYNTSVTTGAINDFEEALKLAEQMIVEYGMGDSENILHPNMSDKYKELIDNEVSELINYAYLLGRIVLENCKDIIIESTKVLKKNRKLFPSDLEKIFKTSPHDVEMLKDIL